LRDIFENGLELDRWLPPGHDYRRRAYQCYAVDSRNMQIDFISDPPPYVQAVENNAVAGGIERRFRIVPPTHPAVPVVRRLADIVLRLVQEGGLATADRRAYLLDVHFIRIATPGKPSPEGVHRDGLVVGSVHLVDQENARGGVTHLFNADGTPLKSLQLTSFLESIVFDDKRLLHHTDELVPIRAGTRGHRDVLLLGLRADSD
jgi:hypothetical protein